MTGFGCRATRAVAGTFGADAACRFICFFRLPWLWRGGRHGGRMVMAAPPVRARTGVNALQVRFAKTCAELLARSHPRPRQSHHL
jgi:hypothetical protein